MLGTVLTVIGWIFAPICSALVVALREQKKKTQEAIERAQQEEDAHRRLVDKALKVLLRRELVDAYRDHVTNEAPLTVERFHEITEVHDTYNGLHGNGTGDAMYEGIAERQIHIVK